MKLFMEINSTDDCASLQNSLDCFVDWCNKIGLKINVCKCRVMKFSRSRATILFDYYISGTKISHVFDDVVYLFFRLSSNFSPNLHIAMISSRALKLLGFRNTFI